MTAPRRVLIRARGHPQIRGTHHKSVEVTRDAEITGRATCVVGVAAGEFPDELHLLRGRVRITISAGSEATNLAGHAVINPGHEVGRRLVIRRSGQPDPDTLAIRSDFTAGDLAPSLRTALADPDTPVLLAIEEVRVPPPLVMLAAPDGPPPPGRLGRLWRHAGPARSLDGRAGSATSPGGRASSATSPGGRASSATSPGGPAGGRAGGPDPAFPAPGEIIAATLVTPLDSAPPAALRWLTAAARRGARLLVPAADPATVALLAAGLDPAPALRLGRLDARAHRQPAIAGLLRNGFLPAVLTLAPADAGAVLGSTGEPAARRIAVPAGPDADVGIGMRWTTVADAISELAGAGEPVTVVLGARERATAPVDAGEVARVLLEAGVPARTLADALRPWGLTRSQVYAWQRPDPDS